MGRNVTLRDIALLSGFSMNTVSKALNGKSGVGKEAAERIRQYAAQLGYQPNMMARSMRGSDNSMIGVLISDISDEFFVSLLAGVEEEATRRGMTVLIQNANEDAATQINGLKKLLSYGCKNIIVTPVQEYGEVIDLLRGEDVRFVIADRVGDGMEDCDRVSINNRGDSRRVVEYLIARGHRRIALLNQASSVQTETERTQGCREALAAQGIAPDPRYELFCRGEEDIRRQLRALMRLRTPPTALFIAKDKLALNALCALREMDVRIPEDLSVFVYGALDWMRLFSPAVNGVRRNIWEIGRASVRVLMEREAYGAAPVNLVLDSPFDIRNSVRTQEEQA